MPQPNTVHSLILLFIHSIQQIAIDCPRVGHRLARPPAGNVNKAFSLLENLHTGAPRREAPCSALSPEPWEVGTQSPGAPTSENQRDNLCCPKSHPLIKDVFSYFSVYFYNCKPFKCTDLTLIYICTHVLVPFLVRIPRNLKFLISEVHSTTNVYKVYKVLIHVFHLLLSFCPNNNSLWIFQDFPLFF